MQGCLEPISQPLGTIRVNIHCISLFLSINILNSCATQGWVKGWDAMKPLYWRFVNCKDPGWPCLTPVANPDQYFRYTASFICHNNFAYNCNSCIAFHLSIILVTYKFTGMIAPFDRVKNLFNLKNIMTKIINLSWNPYFKLLYTGLFISVYIKIAILNFYVKTSKSYLNPYSAKR